MWLHSTTCGHSTLYSSQATDGLVIGLQSANPYGLVTTWHCGDMTGMVLDMYTVPSSTHHQDQFIEIGGDW